MNIPFQSKRATHVRRKIVAYLNVLFAKRIHLGYVEARPMRSYPTPYMAIPEHDTDCSESSAIVLQASGAPTPFVVGAECYTGTFLSQLPHIPKWRTRRGDAVIFTSAAHPDGVHMCLLLEGGLFHPDPLVWSHGRPGVDVMRLSQMRAGFPGDGVVFCKTVPERY